MRTETLGRSKKYMEWIRTQKCCVTNSDYQVVAHHVTVYANRGISQKPSDYWCTPLTNAEHQKLHHMGEKAYWADMGCNPHAFAIGKLLKYIMHTDPDCVVDLLRAVNEVACERNV